MVDLDLRHLSVLEAAGRRHSQSSGQSFAEYRKQRYCELECFVAARKSIYLDLNFWIWLRSPEESPKPASTVQLSSLLNAGVKSGKLFCPVSYAVHQELSKLPPAKRSMQARVMDALSQRVALRNPFDIAEIEYLQLLARSVSVLKGVRTLQIDPVWCPIGHLIAEKYPHHDELPHEFMERSRKVMLDVTWELRMEDYAKMNFPCAPTTTAAKINVERKLSPRNGKSFDRLFAEELDGALDVMSPHIEESFKQLANLFGISAGKEELPERERRVAINLFREIITRGLDPQALPSQRVRAALHAAMRLDDRRDFKQNDLDDFSHAAVAAAYCHVFLTERPLASLLRLALVQKVSSSACSVVGNIDEVIATLIG